MPTTTDAPPLTELVEAVRTAAERATATAYKRGRIVVMCSKHDPELPAAQQADDDAADELARALLLLERAVAGR